MFNEKFWLAVAFLGFVTLIIKYVGPKITKALDAKSKKIAEEILAAKELKEKAVKLLERAEKYYQESEKFAQKLVKDAEDESQKFVAEAKQLLEDEVSKKTAASLARIKLEEESAIREMKVKIVASAIEKFSASLNLDQKNHEELVVTAVKEFGEKL
jgi:F-type H+-transporting ATPase subunit b